MFQLNSRTRTTHKRPQPFGSSHPRERTPIPTHHEILKYTQREITALLTMDHATDYKTKHDLETECMNCIADQTDDIHTTCPAIPRIKIILNAYQKYMVHDSTSHPNLSTIIQALTFRDIYTFTDIYNDFDHIKQHMDHCQTTERTIRRSLRDALPKTPRNYSRTIQHYKRDAIRNQMTTEDTVLEQEIHKIYSYLTHSTVAQHKTNVDDEEWFAYTVDDEDDDYKGAIHDTKWEDRIYSQLTQNMGVFRWQNRYGFTHSEHHGLMHLKPRYCNIKEEVLQNPYYCVPKEVWNQTLRKSTIFFESFARKRIRTRYPETYRDAITQDTFQWKRGEVIRMQDIVTIKLYTDFDELQAELKKCFRFDSTTNIFALNNFDPAVHHKLLDPNAKTIRYKLEQRLRAFYWWRSTLLMVLHKYASKLSGTKALFHGVNAQMVLNNGGTQTKAFCGPLSTSSSYHVARTFATPQGMVLEVTTQYPRLGVCRVFDASVLSEYPEEQEWLLSFAYLRITSVHTRILPGMQSMDGDGGTRVDYTHDMVPVATKTRSIFFALQLFRHQFFSMSAHLEYWLTAFLYLQCGYHEEGSMVKTTFMDSLQRIVQSDNYDVDHDLYRYHQILNMLWNKFENFRKYPNHKQVVKLDVISDNLKPYFMDVDSENDATYSVSFRKIIRIFENVKEIHFINEYRLDDVALNKWIQYLYQNPNHNVKCIKFLYYNYDGPMCDYPNDSTVFHDPEKLDGGLRKILEEKNWSIKHRNIGNIGYQIVLNST